MVYGQPVLEWVAVGACALAGGGGLLSLTTRRQAHGAWREVLKKAAASNGGTLSPGTIFDAPSLRVAVGDEQMTLTLHGIHHTPEEAWALAQLRLSDSVPTDRRLMLSWDLDGPPTGFEHVPEVPYPRSLRLKGHFRARADDPDAVPLLLKDLAPDFLDLRQEAQGDALELTIRGGHVELRVNGLRPTEALVTRIIETIQNTASWWTERLRGSAAGAITKAKKTLASCALCEVKDPGTVQCATCHTPYHRTCFRQAGGCIVSGCPETKSESLRPDLSPHSIPEAQKP